MLLKDLAVPPAGGTSAIQAAIFVLCAALVGILSAGWGLGALSCKFDLLEALEPKSLKFGRLHYLPIYMGILYLIIGSFGSWASIASMDSGASTVIRLQTQARIS